MNSKLDLFYSDSYNINNNPEHYNINQIIDWACLNLTNSYELKEFANSLSSKNLNLSDMLIHLKDRAIGLTNIDSFENLNWRYVSSRLLLLHLKNEIFMAKESLGLSNNSSLFEIVSKFVSLGIYDKNILQFYDEKDFAEMEKEINLDYDLGFDYAGMNSLSQRYLIKHYGKIVETPQQMFLVVAMLIATPENKDKRLDIAKKFYHALASRKLSLATPFILNLRRPKGNLSSCFITSMNDDLNSIYYTLDQLAQISKYAGGVGVNMSRVRSSGSYIKTYKGASGGVLPWIKLINDTAIAVNQLGSRQGSITVALDVWHKDIEEFLEIQTENGDQRKKSFDIYPQVVFNDLFLRRVENNEEWTLMDPHEVRQKRGIELSELWGEQFEEVYKVLEQDRELEFLRKVSARSLMKHFLKTTVEAGLPYAFFKDTTNKLNPNKHVGFIGNANLCTESFSNFKPSNIGDKKMSSYGNEVRQSVDAGEVHTCNLTSINLAQVNENDLEEITRLGIRILDNSIYLTESPIPESQKHNMMYRILGLGAMGLSDYLAVRGIAYNKSSDVVDKLFENIAYYSIDESANLAVERGVYPMYYGSDWQKGIFFGKDENWFLENSQMSNKWSKLIEKVKTSGIRNGGLIAIAPNTSTSLLMGCTASILPIYKKFFIDKNTKGAVPIAPPYLNQDTFWVYKENQNIDQNIVIDVVSKIQKWVDQGISMELILNLQKGMKAKDLYDLYMNAWKSGCKTVYYIRSITLKADSQKEDDCVSCSG